MFKINEVKMKVNFGAKIVNFSVEVVKTKYCSKDNKTLTENFTTQHNFLAEPIYINSFSHHPFHLFRLLSIPLNCSRLWIEI